MSVRAPRLRFDLEDEAWMAAAACKGKAFWFVGHPERQEQAKRLCLSCGVLGECGRYGTRLNLRDVVYGGTTEADREKIRVRREWRAWVAHWEWR